VCLPKREVGTNGERKGGGVVELFDGVMRKIHSIKHISAGLRVTGPSDLPTSTYIQPNDAALSPPKVLWHAKYALTASFLLDTDSVFAAAIGAVDRSFWAEMIQPHIR